jgi:asparagine synthase (glutamine-hydrolysing)
MYKYVAFIWDSHDADSSVIGKRLIAQFSVVHRKWNNRLFANGIAVFDCPPACPPLQAYVLSPALGVIFGRLFSANQHMAAGQSGTAITAKTTTLICSSGGRELVTQYWGSYVAVLRDSENDVSYVIRDCSGKVPCYRAQYEGVHIFFSDIAALSGLSIPGLEIDWHYLANFIAFSEVQIRESALCGVKEVLAGECVAIRDGANEQQAILWDPSAICREPLIEDYTDAAERLRETTQQCVDAWSSTYGRITHSLSGGLDSAIVLACLSRSSRRPVITCLNRFGAGGGEDERKYARLAARAANVELIEQSWDIENSTFDERLIAARPTPKPSIPFYVETLDAIFRDQLAQSTGSEGTWTGQGGDHLFWQVSDILGAADYIYHHRFGAKAFSIIRDTSRLSGVPFGSVLIKSVQLSRDALPWRPADCDARKFSFVRRDLLAESGASRCMHPWTTGNEDLPKGKQAQIFFLAELLNRHRPSPFSDAAQEHHPLISQPLIELCLKIPIYVLVSGGRQRALARDAFAGYVPKEILAREDKGGTGARLAGQIRHSAAFLKDLLLDGVLVHERIVDRADIERHLLHGQPLKAQRLTSLLACISAESWARTWRTNLIRTAA